MVVILAAEVQRPVDNQMRQVMSWAAPLRCRLRPNNTQRQDDFRRGMLISQDVGGLVLAPMASVQTSDHAI
jgi:hypothetical protein